MYELAVVVDLAGKVRIVLLGRLEHDLGDVSYVCVCWCGARRHVPWSHW
jgi:hypothetical protein